MIEREYLTTERPLVDQVAEKIVGLNELPSILDLSGVTCIVPTLHSARRLKEALALVASKSQRAVCPPEIYTPETFLSQQIPNDQELSPVSETFSHWAMYEAIKRLDNQWIQSLFPSISAHVDKSRLQDFSWGMSVVNPIMKMRRSLSDNGLTISKVAQLPPAELEEPFRWQALSILEKIYLKILRSYLYFDEFEEISKLAHSNKSLKGIEGSIILAGVPGIPPVLRNYLNSMATGDALRIKVWIYTVDKNEKDFDDWGCPIFRRWFQKPIQKGSPNIHFTRSLEPSQMIDSVVDWYTDAEAESSEVALGVFDSSIIEPLESKINSSDYSAFNPSGRSFRYFELYKIMESFSNFLKKAHIYESIELARYPQIFSAIDTEVTHREFLVLLDRLRLEHLVTSIDGIENWIDRMRDHGGEEIEQRNKSTLKKFFHKLDEWRGKVLRGNWSDGFMYFLADIYMNRELDTRRDSDRLFSATSSIVVDTLDELKKISKLSPSHGLDLLMRFLSKKLVHQERSGGEIDLIGWMEMLWEPARSIALVGLQDTIIPETISGDIFLPEKFRSKLGLPTNEDRLARDTYIIHTLAAQRSGDGGIQVFFCDRDAAGNPQRPSRLCFLCDDKDLPSRVIRLMGESNGVVFEKAPIFQNTWKLKIPSPDNVEVNLPSRMSVTSFSSYLNCPFRFYLEHVLGMSTIDRSKMELDPREFGNIFHKVLENYGNDPEARSWLDEKKIRQFFKSNLEKLIHGIYGVELPAALWIQYESLLQRLNAVASVEAKNRASGWKIQGVEIRIHKHYLQNLKKVWEIDGMELAGTIDRIETNDVTGQTRLVDFKTSNNAKEIFDAHAQRLRENDEWHETREPWQIFNWEKKVRGKNQNIKYLWKNLQLPLYAQAWAKLEPGNCFPGVAYFNAPKTVQDTRVSSWEGFNKELAEHASQCARSVIQNIKSGRFTPPNPEPEYELFPEFFIQDPSKIIEWRGSKNS